MDWMGFQDGSDNFRSKRKASQTKPKTKTTANPCQTGAYQRPQKPVPIQKKPRDTMPNPNSKPKRIHESEMSNEITLRMFRPRTQVIPAIRKVAKTALSDSPQTLNHWALSAGGKASALNNNPQ